jgi:hypothetical protein
MSASKPKKPYWKMNAEELAEATKDFERGLPFEAGRPLSPENQAKWDRARRGRPRVGKGAVRVFISVEAGLLEKADAFAQKRGVTRSQLIAQGLRKVIGNGASNRKSKKAG